MFKALIEVKGDTMKDLFHGLLMARRAMSKTWCRADAHRHSAYNYVISQTSNVQDPLQPVSGGLLPVGRPTEPEGS